MTTPSVHRRPIRVASLICFLACSALTLSVPVTGENSTKTEGTPEQLSGAKPSEKLAGSDSDNPVLDTLEPIADEPDDRLVVVPEVEREGARFFLSSFRLPEKLAFAGQVIPLDNWQVRERIEYEF